MPCEPPKSNADRLFTVYDEYYCGERDEENRKNGQGAHHWSGPRSLEWYEGQMLRDTMHGTGEYFIRYQGGNHAAMTYEGQFYNNNMHGYGVVSYPDGKVYNGLFYNNSRWGPGIVSHADARQDVGLWRGTQLVRLAWRPPVPSVAIDLVSMPLGCETIAPHRKQLCSNVKTLGEVNSALELLKQCGTDPLAATEKWTKLYPKNCTDTRSQLCNVQAFDLAYYDNQINTLIQIRDVNYKDEDKEYFYAWNNNKMIIHMMKHCYKHEKQRAKTGINLKKILSGQGKFKKPGKHDLDCRTLLMASYLGNIANVAQLVNECDVNPNVTDVQGNSAIMYAACGDQTEIIHFLIDAGAKVDYYNDACCTPLGVALLRFALARWDIAPTDMATALLPREEEKTNQEPETDTTLEWNIERVPPPAPAPTIQPLSKSPSKISKLTKTSSQKSLPEKKTDDTDEKFSEEKQLFHNISNEFNIRVNEEFAAITPLHSIPYLFEVVDITKDVNLTEGEVKKPAEKRSPSKIMKDSLMPSREMIWQSHSNAGDILDTKEQLKEDKLGRILLTILQLLSEGADPRKVRCPQPAIFIATAAVCGELIDYLVQHGADINETYPQNHGYTVLDIALGGQFTCDNLEVIRSLLKNGASVDHRLNPPPLNVHQGRSTMIVAIPEEDKPTLLIAVIYRNLHTEDEEEIRHQILELLLEYGCDPTVQCKGRSALDVVLTKTMEIFDIFIKSTGTNLNAIINNKNQNVLMKMFYLPFCKTLPLLQRLQMLTNLLLFGADPLLKCQFEDECYDNLFVYINKNLADMKSSRKPSSPKEDKGKKSAKNLKTKSSKGAAKSPPKANEFNDYKQAADLVLDCARMLYIRWLQAKLLKDLIEVVNRYNHRHWHVILRECKNQKCTGLWINAPHALEIWDILKTTKKKIYMSDRILKHLLCIVHYCNKKTNKEIKGATITTKLKSQIESEVYKIVREHKMATASEVVIDNSTIRPYVTPELTEKGLEKFNICFECAMPLIANTTILCISCKLITFCSFRCIKINVERVNCHPCSPYLKGKYSRIFEKIEEEDLANSSRSRSPRTNSPKSLKSVQT